MAILGPPLWITFSKELAKICDLATGTGFAGFTDMPREFLGRDTAERL
jgi:hypothetical protein